MTTQKALEKHPRAAELEHSAEDIRWATPDVVAQYRAKRLHCKTIVDVGCGIGFQTFAFAQHCGHVYAIELDKEKIEKAKRNAAVLGLKNITFIHGDALSTEVIKQLKSIDVVFCDPQRLPEETVRKTATIQPDIHQLLESYGKFTKRIAIEFPPQIKEIPFDCEREYLSWQGRLNRLTLYFGSLKRSERSVVVLPQEAVLNNDPAAKLRETTAVGQFIYDVDPAVIKAELLAELSSLTKTSLISRGKTTLFTSIKLVESPFFVHRFTVLNATDFEPKTMIDALKDLHAGQVVLRYSVDPQDYWKIRATFEKQLRGAKVVHLFKVGEKAVICEELG